jgi:hypothetical protein
VETTAFSYRDVEVVAATADILKCRIGARIVAIPRLQLLPDTTISRVGDRGTVVLPRWVAEQLGLCGLAGR